VNPALERWLPNADYMLEATAVDIFLDELVVPSLDQNHSRGFLDGMHNTFAASSPNSTLVSAAKVVVLASLANRHRRDSLFGMVRKQYGQLLVEYVTSLSSPSENLSAEQFFTAVLLGIYEVSLQRTNTDFFVNLFPADGMQQCLAYTTPCSRSRTHFNSPKRHLLITVNIQDRRPPSWNMARQQRGHCESTCLIDVRSTDVGIF
jgi:hypothetical protein